MYKVHLCYGKKYEYVNLSLTYVYVHILGAYCYTTDRGKNFNTMTPILEQINLLQVNLRGSYSLLLEVN